MKKTSRIDKSVKIFISYTIFLGILSLAFFFMPFVNQKSEETMIPLQITGICFWIGIMGVIISTVFLNRIRKKDSTFIQKKKNVFLVGALCFFQNIYGMIADVLVLVTGIGFVIVINLTSNLYVQFSFLALLIFSLGMHCMLNGICYKYVCSKRGA